MKDEPTLSLEAELPSQRDAPGAPVVEVATEVSAIHIAGRVAVIVLVEGIQEGRCDRDARALANPEILGDAQVRVPEAGSAKCVLAQAAVAE